MSSREVTNNDERHISHFERLIITRQLTDSVNHAFIVEDRNDRPRLEFEESDVNFVIIPRVIKQINTHMRCEIPGNLDFTPVK
jgi:hypothetical protein